MKNKISVVVPIYNSENSLDVCLKSIVRQNYKNFEIILIDDGSTDKSQEICRQYQKEYQNVYYYYQLNSGVSAARNVGIDKATGDLIYFMDSDDILSPELFEIIVENFKNDVECLWFKYDKIYSYDVCFKKTCDVNVDKFCSNKYVSKLLEDNDGFLWNKVFKLDIIKDKKLKFNENIKICEDLLFNVQYSQYIKTIIKIDYIGYGYYQSLNSSFNKKDNIGWFSIIDAYKIIEQMLNEEPAKDIAMYNIVYYSCEGYIRNKYNKIKIGKKIDRVNIFDDNFRVIIASKNIDVKRKIKLLLFIIFPNIVFRVKQQKISGGKNE